MSFNKSTRKPDKVTETFIATAVIVFFIGMGIFFFYADKQGVVDSIEKKDVHTTDTPNTFIPPKPVDQGIPLPAEIKPEQGIYPGKFLRKELPVTLPEKEENVFFVNPPIPALNTVAQKAVVNANIGEIITSAHHSQIVIPPQAFLDKDGNLVTGDVEVKYREFYNYLDIFLSGIPMNYDDEQLESAGMIEITASQGNEPVFVNQNNKINVLLASMKKSPDYNLYYFDTKQNKWIYKGKDNVIMGRDGAPGWQFTGGIQDSVERKFSFAPDKYKVRIMCTSDTRPKRSFFLGKKKEPYSFSFHFMRSPKSLPELRELGTVKWKYSGKNAHKVYDRLFRFNHSASAIEIMPGWWNTLSILPIAEDETYLLSLFNAKDTFSVKILPQLRSEVGRRKFNDRFKKYLVAQNKRLEAEQSAFEKFKRDTTAYYAANGRYISTRMTADYYVMRQFQIDGFGVWNCDQPQGWPKGAVVAAHFVDQNGNTLRPERVFLVDKEKNTVYTYYSGKLDNFRFNPSSKNMVWAVFPGNRLGVIRAKEFREKYAQARGRCVFQFEINENEVVSKEELRSKLKFDL